MSGIAPVEGRAARPDDRVGKRNDQEVEPLGGVVQAIIGN
jgi:hypothetical protein